MKRLLFLTFLYTNLLANVFVGLDATKEKIYLHDYTTAQYRTFDANGTSLSVGYGYSDKYAFIASYNYSTMHTYSSYYGHQSQFDFLSRYAFDLNSINNFNPYVQAGGGFSTIFTDGKYDVNLHANTGVGVNYVLFNKVELSLDLNYRFRFFFKEFFNQYQGPANSVVGSLGIKIFFNDAQFYKKRIYVKDVK